MGICKAYEVWRRSERSVFGYFKVQIDNTKVELSNVLQKIHISTRVTSRDLVEPDLPQNVEELPQVNRTDYVKETLKGFEVWGWY